MANIDSKGLEIVMMAAVDKNFVIGNSESNDIPWRMPEFENDPFFKFRGPFSTADMGAFKILTAGGNAVMGRLTAYSMNRMFPLPQNVKAIDTATTRDSTVVTRMNRSEFEKSFPAMNKERPYTLVESIEDGIRATDPNATRIAIIGGESMYKAGLQYADIVYLTQINQAFNGDVKFPEIPSNFAHYSIDPFKGTEFEGRMSFNAYARDESLLVKKAPEQIGLFLK